MNCPDEPSLSAQIIPFDHQSVTLAQHHNYPFLRPNRLLSNKRLSDKRGGCLILLIENTILSARYRQPAGYLKVFSVLVLLLVFTLAIPFNAYAESNDYRLGAGDEIRIQVYQEADLSMTLRLDESGTFDYPYLGTITARNRSLDQLRETVTEGLLQDVLVNPNVNVSIVKYRDFYIGGEVKRTGGYPYQPGLTVKQAITLAGGVTEWASSSKYEILREGNNVVEPATNNTPIRPGDTVTILEGLF